MDLLKRFFRFVLPSIVAMWVYSLYTIVDGIFVARGVGDQALAAVNIAMPFTSFIFTLGIILATGTSTVISISLGQNDLERARRYFSQNLVVTAGASLVLTVLVLVFLEPFARLLGATDSTLAYVKEYLAVIALFAVFFTVSYNLEIQVKANGAPHVSTIGVTACAIMNVVLDYVFVMKLHWGVKGAALATGLAQVTSTGVFLLYFLTHTERLRIGRFTPELGVYRRSLPLGLSDGFSELSNGLVIFLFNRVILAVLGEDAVVSYTIIGYINTLVLMTMIGISQGMQPLVSYHLGAGKKQACHRLLAYGVGMVAVCSAASFAISQLGAPAIVTIFLGRDSPLVPASITALRTYGWAFLVLGFNVLFAGFFTAVERPAWALTISSGRSLILLAASLFVLSTLFGGAGIWVSALVAELLCLGFTVVFALKYRAEEGRAKLSKTV